MERALPAIVPWLTLHQDVVSAERVAGFFARVLEFQGTGLVTPSAFIEYVHFAVKLCYHQALLDQGENTRHWMRYYKRDPRPLQSFLPLLNEFRMVAKSAGFLILQSEDLGPIRSGRAFDEELVDVCCRYGLDSGDAAILIEAGRAGIPNIVTMDADLQRASADFNIYTWL